MFILRSLWWLNSTYSLILIWMQLQWKNLYGSCWDFVGIGMREFTRQSWTILWGSKSKCLRKLQKKTTVSYIFIKNVSLKKHVPILLYHAVPKENAWPNWYLSLKLCKSLLIVCKVIAAPKIYLISVFWNCKMF